jgi:polysaccharide biosynthesis/export protein
MLRLGRYSPIVAIVLLLHSALLHGASPIVPTPEQMRALQQLPKEQRELLRRALKENERAQTSVSEALDVPSDGVLEPEPDRLTHEPAPVRLRGGETLLITFRLAPPADSPTGKRDERVTPPDRDNEHRRLQQARVPSERVFTLDQFGALRLDNIGRIPLAGLTEQEAAERLAAESAFDGFLVRVKRLPLDPELRRFGHDLFAGTQKTFTPVLDVPVPIDYVLGPGDTLQVQLLGKENVEHELVVTRDGTLQFPGIGPIGVAGKRFAQVERELSERVRRQFIGVRAVVTLGRLRSMRVFVLGEVERPGSYTVSSLSTLTNALFASGGVKPTGSLRDVQLKRSGALVTRFDLYDLLLHGDTRHDARLLPGDVIFVPPIGATVGVGGRVRRPAIYELRDEKTVEHVIAMAGGLLPDAYPQRVQIQRVVAGAARSTITADLTQPESSGAEVRDGDIVRVFEVASRLERSVTLAGWVTQAGTFEWTENMRLTDLIPSLAVLRNDAETRYVLIRREDTEHRFVQFVSTNLAQALASPTGRANIELMPRDEVHVFGLHENRAALIKPMLERARATASPTQPAREVGIEGAVHHAGTYPWSPGMTVQDLLDAAGGLTDQAYTLEAELTRSIVMDGKAREHARKLISLNGREGEDDERFALEPYDRLVVRRMPRWDSEGVIELVGEVRFPGRYPIFPGERLSQVIQRAGGLTDVAYPRAAVFLRQSVRDREQQYLERLTAQLERDVGLLKTEGPQVGVRQETAVVEGEALLRQMRATKATGRMVIKLDAVMDARDDYNIVVQPGDRLIIPQKPEEVTVVGEVYYPTSHLHGANLSRDDYIRLSGGITERGNKSAAYVVRADGSVSPPGRWFNRDVDIEPGDTVIVPLKVDRISNLKLFTDVTTILYQIAITAAALDVVGVF